MRFLWPRVPYRHLIGPTFFPVYLLVLKLALAVTLVVTAGFAVLGPTGDAESRPRLLEILTFLIRRGLIAFGSTTLAFAALDLWQSRFIRQTSWDPRLLPAVVRLEDRVSRLDSLIQLVLVSAGLVWLLLVPFFPILIFGRRRSSPRAHVNLERRLRADGCADRCPRRLPRGELHATVLDAGAFSRAHPASSRNPPAMGDAVGC